jgi:hypothetical protein
MRKTRFLPKLLLGPAAAGLMVSGCTDPATTAPAEKQAEARGTTAAPAEPFVAHRVQARGAATFSWLGGTLPEGMAPVDAAWHTLRQVAQAERMAPAVVGAARLRSVHDNGQVVVAQFEQRVDEIEVFHAGLSVAFSKEMRPVAASGTLARTVRPKARDFGADAREAVARAYQAMNGVEAAAVSGTGAQEAGYEGYAVPAQGGLTAATARAKKVWYPQEGGLVPAHYVEVEVGKGGATDTELRAYVIAAKGGVLFEHDLTAADSFTYRVWADKTGFQPWDSPQGNGYTPHPTGMPDGKEPGMEPSSLVTLQNLPFSKNDPWLAPTATETKGNNVWAYGDVVAPDGFNMGDIAVTTTASKTFDRTFDPRMSPKVSEEATRAITTNLFYIVNYLHDQYYDPGWDEKSFNPQESNFDRGGVGNDAIKAEAQDYGGTNNANASTPADGRQPRIQMYLWRTGQRPVTITEPMDLAGSIAATSASFGPQMFDTSGELVLINDGKDNPIDGCEEPYVNAAALAGKFAVIERGGPMGMSCPFVDKVRRAEAAGATGVVIINNATGLPPNPMGGTGAISIPTIGISKEDGDKIRAKLGMGTRVRLSMKAATVERDGSLDTLIVSHEWAHILSNRLVGNGSGLSNTQGRGMGEGWSDFVALLTVVRPEDAMVPANKDWKGTFAVGAHSYAVTNGHYDGIRRYPYSTDMTKNPLTFKHIQNGTALPATPVPRFGLDGASNAEVHNTGEVWTQMLWECYTRMLAMHPFAEASKRMRNYLVAGLKLTPNAPTILEARDAILAAAYAGDPKDFRVCYEGFAKRGAGVGAVGPAKGSTDNKGVTESFSVGNDLVYVSAEMDDKAKTCDADGVLDAGEVGTLTVKVRNTGASALTATTVTLKTDNKDISFPDGDTVTFAKTEPYQVGAAVIKVAMGKDVKGKQTFKLDLDIKDPSLAVQRPITASVTMDGNYDDVPETSATDTMDARATAWSAAGDMKLDGKLVWKQVFTGSAGRFNLESNPAPSDQYLVSPDLKVGMAGDLQMTVKHRHSFEAQLGQYQDGGVVELSEDGGMTWKDIGDKSSMNGYQGQIYRDNQSLSLRRAFVGNSVAYPSYMSTTFNLGAAYAGKTVRVRFRLATDDGTGGAGWDIDEVAFMGLSNKPFASRMDHRGMCINRPPEANAGVEQTVAPGAMVTLDGSLSSDPDGDTLTYRWTQSSGAMVMLGNAAEVKPVFQAPDVKEATELTFSLVVSDGKLESKPAGVKVIIDPALKPPKMEDPMNGCSCQVGGVQGPAQAGRSAVTLGGLLVALGALLRRRKK